MDTPKLDFEASKAGFSYIFGIVSPRNPSSKTENAKNAKNAEKANHLRSANAQSATTKAYSTTMARAKKGGR